MNTVNKLKTKPRNKDIKLQKLVTIRTNEDVFEKFKKVASQKKKTVNYLLNEMIEAKVKSSQRKKVVKKEVLEEPVIQNKKGLLGLFDKTSKKKK